MHCSVYIICMLAIHRWRHGSACTKGKSKHIKKVRHMYIEYICIAYVRCMQRRAAYFRASVATVQGNSGGASIRSDKGGSENLCALGNRQCW